MLKKKWKPAIRKTRRETLMKGGYETHERSNRARTTFINERRTIARGVHKSRDSKGDDGGKS